ncbi:MAG TPA: glycine cleavage T C-terminal barrel domain-containing protein [Acidimicrobiales bacterium]
MPAGGPIDLRSVLGWFPEGRDVLRVAGPDAIAYLQGQLSQDIDALAVGSSARSFVLQPTGKVDAWVRVTRAAADEVVVDVDGGHGEALAARLRRFLLRTKADLDALDWRALAIRGPGATEAVPAELGNDALVVPAGWPGVDGVDLLGRAVAPPPGVPEVDASAYESLRIRSGVPRMGAELTGATIPTEAGQWVIDASVSFTKGCFTGQELVARIDSRGGHVPRNLRGLVADAGAQPPVGASVVVEGGEVGSVTSAAPAPGAGGALALAYVRRAVTPPAAAVVRHDGDALPVTVVDLPMD